MIDHNESFSFRRRTRRDARLLADQAGGPLMDSLESRAMLTGDLAATWGPLGLATFYVPGEKVTVDPGITNVGDAVVQGKATLQVFLTENGVVNPGDTPVVAIPNITVTIAPGNTLIRKSTFTLSNTLAQGSYVLVARVVPGAGVPNPNTANDEANSGGLSLQYRFGTFGPRQNVIMSLRDADGTVATFRGSGVIGGQLVDDGFGGLTLNIQSGNPGASISIVATGGTDGFFDVKNINLDGAANKLDMPGVRLTGDVLLPDPFKSIRFGKIEGPSTIDITAPSGTPELRVVDKVFDLTLNSTVGFKLISVDCWQDTGVIDENIINAPFIVSAISNCRWAPSMNLTGTSGGKSLGSLRVPGSIESEFWRTAGRIGTINAGSILDTNMTVAGAIDTIKTIGNINGATIAATSFGAITVGVSLINSRILAGTSLGFNSALDNPPGSTDDLFNSGSIKSIVVTLDMTGSIVAAGINPRPPGAVAPAPFYLNGDAIAVDTTSAISKITVNGIIDGASRFMAPRMAATARVAGVNVPTLRDTRFQLPDFLAPTATFEGGLAGVAPYRVVVVYHDAVSVDPETVRTTDLAVTGPGAFTGTARFLTGTISTAGNEITAIYELTPPGGSWDSAENGIYTVSLSGATIKDLAGNTLGAGQLGQFEIRVTQSPIAQFPAPQQATHGQTAVSNDGALHATFIEGGSLFYRKVTAAGVVTVTGLPALAGVLRSAVVLTGAGSPVIVAASDSVIRRYTFDGANWNSEDLSVLSPPVGSSIIAISAAYDANQALRVGYIIGGPVAPSASSTTTSVYLLTQDNPGESADTRVVFTGNSFNSTGTNESAVRSFQIATDAQSKVHVIFTPEYFRVGNLSKTQLYYTNNLGGVNFAAPTLIAAVVAPQAGDAGLEATLAVNAVTNRVGIAYAFIQRNAATGDPIKSILRYTAQNNLGQFSAAVTVADKSLGYKGTGDRGTGALPSLRFDAQGRAHLAFSDYTTVKEGASLRSTVGQIRHAVLVGTTWTLTTVYSQTTPATASMANVNLLILGNRLIFTGDARTALDANTSATQFLFTELSIA